MSSDSSFSRLTDAWNASAPGRAMSMARRSIAALARGAGLQTRPDPYRVLWVDDGDTSALPRAVTSLAHARRNYRIEAFAPDNDTALETLLHEQRPRLMVVDVNWCARVGDAAVRRLHRHACGTDWVLRWDAPSLRWLKTLMHSGARGAVLRTSDEAALARAFDAVLGGEIWLPRQVMQWLYATLIDAPGLEPAASLPSSAWPADSELTVRESEVMDLIRHGLTNRELGERLGVSINTVKKHAANAFEKRGIRSRRQTLG